MYAKKLKNGLKNKGMENNSEYNWLTCKPKDGYRPTDKIRETDPEISSDNKVIYETTPMKTGLHEEKSQVIFQCSREIFSAVKVRTTTLFGPDIIRYRFRDKEFKAMGSIYNLIAELGL